MSPTKFWICDKSSFNVGASLTVLPPGGEHHRISPLVQGFAKERVETLLEKTQLHFARNREKIFWENCYWTDFFSGYKSFVENITPIDAKAVLIKKKRIDSWFISKAHLNIYRGCTHNCAYCDGRYEGYYVPGNFGRDISAKTNAPTLLDAALNPQRKRKPIQSGYVVLGGGVSDSYQPAEMRLSLSRECLTVILKWRRAVHILTKSTLVERDLPLLRDIHQSRQALLSMSFSTVDDAIARVFEPGCPLPSQRLAALEQFTNAGIPVGMFLMPVIPGITDTAGAIEKAVAAARQVGASYVIFGGMTLKAGRQQSHFMNVLHRYSPGLEDGYKKIYGNNKWGMARPQYYLRLEQRFVEAARAHQMPRRIPPSLFWSICSPKEAVEVTLGQLDYLQRADGGVFPFSSLATKIAALELLPVQSLAIANQSRFDADEMNLLHEIATTRGTRYFERFN